MSSIPIQNKDAISRVLDLETGHPNISFLHQEGFLDGLERQTNLRANIPDRIVVKIKWNEGILLHAVFEAFKVERERKYIVHLWESFGKTIFKCIYKIFCMMNSDCEPTFKCGRLNCINLPPEGQQIHYKHHEEKAKVFLIVLSELCIRV